MPSRDADRQAPPLQPQPGPATPRVVASDVLLGGGREIRIAHGGETYRLSLTRQGKLILTK